MKYLNEFLGTFFLVLVIGMCVLDPNTVGLWAPLAIGSALAVLVYAGGHVSGAHYNPAVSLAVFLRKKLSSKDLVLYWIVQLAGGALGAIVTLFFKEKGAPEALVLNYSKALLGEFLFTFLLCYVVLNVATTRATAGNSYFGWAIGFTVLAGAYAVGPISSAAFNPAVALAISILDLSSWSNFWVYLVANLLGGAVAAFLVNAIEKEPNNLPS